MSEQPDLHPFRTYFRESLRGDRLAVLGIIIGILTVPFVWWVGLIFVAVGSTWARWSFMDWKDAHQSERGFLFFLKEAAWDTHQYAAIPKELAADEPPQPTISDPAFNLVARPGFRFVDMVALDGNYLKSRPKPLTNNAYFPIVLTFENFRIFGNDTLQDIDDVWAQISYHPVGVPDLEMARISTGVWVDDPLPDVAFPLQGQKHLVLGAWKRNGTKPFKNEFWLFEYSRELHRAERMVKHFQTPQRLNLEVVLTPNGYHHLAERFLVEMELLDTTTLVMEGQPYYNTGRITRIEGKVVTLRTEDNTA